MTKGSDASTLFGFEWKRLRVDWGIEIGRESHFKALDIMAEIAKARAICKLERGTFSSLEKTHAIYMKLTVIKEL